MGAAAAGSTSFEMLDERMQAGYAALKARLHRRLRPVAGGVGGLQAAFTPAIASIRDVDTLFHGTEYSFIWCQEFEQEPGNAGAVIRAICASACDT